MNSLTLFFWLLVGHALCDYPLQGDFLARAKNHKVPIAGVPFYQGLLWHALIHGGSVALVTHSVCLGMLETTVHILIDFAKCNGTFGEGRNAFDVDQALHVLCKVLWALLVPFAG
jgi:hypothetical protein